MRGRLLLLIKWKIVGPKKKRWRVEIGEWRQRVKIAE
jgi:hypothetical protein